MNINGKDSTTVKFETFIFVPCFKLGPRNARFHLMAWKRGKRIITSTIIAIHYVGRCVYLETERSLYRITGKFDSLKKVQEYFEDPNFTSREFFDRYIPKISPTQYGWKIF